MARVPPGLPERISQSRQDPRPTAAVADSHKRSSEPQRKVSADSGGRLRTTLPFFSAPPPHRSIPSLCIISHLSFLLHACRPRNSNPESQLGHSETQARTSASHPKEKSQTGHVYVSALQILWPSHAGAHTPAPLPTCSGSKGHAFGAGRGDNASDVDKQAAVKVAGCKSGLLSSGV